MADLQRHRAVRQTIQPHLEKLRKNELFSTLKQRRDFLVHHGMLELKSRGSVGTTEGNRIKLTLPFPVSPHESSDAAYARYKEICRTDKFWRGIGPDCDSAPAIWRTWMIPQFPDRDLLDVAFEAWKVVGELLSATVIAFQGEALDLTMSCRHNPEDVRIKRYSQREFFLSVDGVDFAEEARKYREWVAAGKPAGGPR